MNNMPDYEYIAIEIGDLVKYSSSEKEINRTAKYSFKFAANNKFVCEAITSIRAALIYKWIMTLASQKMDNAERHKLLVKFIDGIVCENLEEEANKILVKGGVLESVSIELEEFISRNFHSEIHKHCRKLYRQENYFHAVFEAVKVYNNLVKEKSSQTQDGKALMMCVWGEKGTLKITKCQNQWEKNFEDGVKFLSAGLMSAIRNPTAHEPALYWPISKEDSLDMLSFVSYLLRQLDKATYIGTMNV